MAQWRPLHVHEYTIVSPWLPNMSMIRLWSKFLASSELLNFENRTIIIKEAMAKNVPEGTDWDQNLMIGDETADDAAAKW